jgi:hypothetical protein
VETAVKKEVYSEVWAIFWMGIDGFKHLSITITKRLSGMGAVFILNYILNSE